MIRFFVPVCILGFGISALLALLTGCNAGRPVNEMQDEVTNCLLSGGHPHLGSNENIVCRY